MICPSCGREMNHHADKPLDPRDAMEASRMDSRLGVWVEEVHACPNCGRSASRAG